MAVSDKSGTQLAEGIGGYLNRENINYCIYTNHVGEDTRDKFEKVNIYKKSEIVEEEFKIEHNCDGGFVDMLNHIKDNTGFNKYCRFLRFTNDQDLENLIRAKLVPLMNNYLDTHYSGTLSLDTDILLQFCDRLSKELIKQGVVPNIYSNNTASTIAFLLNPVEALDKWKEFSKSRDYNYHAKRFFKNEGEITRKYILKSVVYDVYLERVKRAENGHYYNIIFKDSVSDNFWKELRLGGSFKSSLIAPALNLIYTYRCSEGHEGQSDPENIALKTVYASILLVCERLSIIFERIDELDKLAVDIEEIEPVSEIKEESSNQYAAEDTHAEQAPNLTEKSEEPKKEDGVIKAKATGIGVKVTGQKIDLTQFKKPENL